MIKKAVVMRKHLEVNRKDKDGKFRLILVESRIHRLARYYKVSAAACFPKCNLQPDLSSHVVKHQVRLLLHGLCSDILHCWCAACEEAGAQLEVRVIHCFSFGGLNSFFVPCILHLSS